MYILNKENKILEKIQDTTFFEQNLKERYDLQEWIDKSPDVLGEELLIIQKEFDEFDKTRERLDLLALDLKGNLVLIENKLDDSGRDVTWQALKYVSYCSSLNKSQIIEIYQKYLNQKFPQDTEDASENIREFLGKGSIDEVSLNLGYSQRIILVAREFRPEVTSTVIWLRGNNIDIQCVKVVPYILGEKIIIDIDKIIPIPEAENYMVKLSAKEVEERSANVTKNITENIYSEYWSKLLSYCQEENFELYENRTTSKDSWISAGSGIASVQYTFVLLKSELRIEIYISRPSISENKFIYDRLFHEKEEIERQFNGNLKWERLDHKKASRISVSKPFDRDNKDEWNDAIKWHYQNMKRFENALKEPLSRINGELKSKFK